MNKQEFEARIGKEVSNSNYEIIETVYTFHPCISETKGKDQIADLYTTYGMRIIKDMLKTACKAQDLEREKDKVESEINQLKLQQAKIVYEQSVLKTGSGPS